MTLPKLNSVPACVKCGSPSISAAHERKAGMEYIESISHRSINRDNLGECLVDPERMVRTCWRCGYQWDETVLEKEAAK